MIPDTVTGVIDRVDIEHAVVKVCLILGDSLVIAPQLEGVGAVISDPPYGMDWDTDSTRFSGGQSPNIYRQKGTGGIRRGRGNDSYGEILHDDEPFDPSPWIAYPKCVLFGMNHFAQRLPVGTTLVWVKKDERLWGTFLSDAELAWMKGGHGVYLYYKSFPPPVRASDAGGNPCKPVGIHPTQKPVSLMTWCMEKAKVVVGELVLDPYAGSGSTVISCLRTGRNCIAIEKSPEHYKTMVDRVRQEASQGVLL